MWTTLWKNAPTCQSADEVVVAGFEVDEVDDVDDSEALLLEPLLEERLSVR